MHMRPGCQQFEHLDMPLMAHVDEPIELNFFLLMTLAYLFISLAHDPVVLSFGELPDTMA